MSHSTKFVKVLTPIAFAIALASCGGGDTSFGGGGTSSVESGNAGKVDINGNIIVSKAESLDFSASTMQLMSSGKKEITLSAVVKDKNNNTISDEDVTFSVDNGGTISIAEENKGVVKIATLTPGSSKANRTLKVIASVGTLEPKEILIDVVGTRIGIDGAASITINKQPEYIIKLQDSANDPIANTEVNISTDFGTISPQVVTTDASGEIKVVLTAKTNGTANIKAEALNAVANKQVMISGNDFALIGTDINKDGKIDASDYEVKLGNAEKITVKWLVNGTPQKNKIIMIRATRGTLLSADGKSSLSPALVKTNDKGAAEFAISSVTAGSATIIAEAKDGGLTATLSREFIATTPAYLSALASPTLIAPTTSSAIVARVRDEHDNPVKNIAINFNLEDTVNGTLSSAKAITDSLGRAEITYTAGNSSSSLNAVIIKTKLENSAFNIDEQEVKLTVGGDAVRLTLGHDQLVSPDEVFYIKKFGVIVTDSAGNPIKDKKISFKISPNKYYKGFSIYNPISKLWEQNILASCASEDANKNDKMDKGEDVNHNGKLEPTHDATVTGAGITDEQGKVTIEVIYPKNTAGWSEQRIESTTAVNGTEYKEYTDFILPLLAADMSNGKVQPPNIHSPYGTWGTCTDDPYTESPAEAIKAPEITMVLSQTDMEVGQLENTTTDSLWYAVFINGKRANKNEYVLDTSDIVKVEDGPNNDFRLVDKDPNKNDSGFYITVTSKPTTDRPLSKTQPFYYKDNSIGTDDPRLILNGLQTIYLNKGSVYKELGANAIDQLGNKLDVTISGNVDTNKVGTYTVIYRTTDADGRLITLSRTIIVKDNDVPVITLNGASSIMISKNQTYNEPGAVAQDNSDGDISANIQTSGTVNSSIAGTYYINYSVEDSSGNIGVATRTVIVDGAPVITLLGDSEIKIGKGSIFTDPGATAQDIKDGNISSSIVINGTVNPNVVGEYILTYSISDSDGLTATKTRKVIIDGAPVITLLGDPEIKIGKGSTYSEPGATAQDGLDGNITSSIVISGSVDTNTVGEYTLTYTVTDSNGLSATKTRKVTVDGAPTITLQGDSEMIIGKGGVYSESGATAQDGLDGNISSDIIINGTVDTNTVGEYTLTYTVSDSDGLTATETRRVIVDGAPIITLQGDSPMTIAKDSTYNEPGATAQDGIDGNVSSDIVTTGTVDTSTVGDYTITYTVTDSDGLSATKERIVTVQ